MERYLSAAKRLFFPAGFLVMWENIGCQANLSGATCFFLMRVRRKPDRSRVMTGTGPESGSIP